MAANDRQVGGEHYQTKGYQPWDLIHTHKLSFLRGNLIKYLARYPDKGQARVDLEKAQHYHAKIQEVGDQSYVPRSASNDLAAFIKANGFGGQRAFMVYLAALGSDPDLLDFLIQQSLEQEI